MAETVSKVERILNVLAILLDTSRFLSRNEITAAVSGYPEGEAACRRAFERDKETLRAMGVPVLTQTQADGVEVGYRVRTQDYFLADLHLDDDESAALQLAVSAVALDAHAGAGALLKLSGASATETPLIAALPSVPALAVIFDAIRQRAQLLFEYRGTDRVVEPWALRSARGRWYLIACDTAHGERRTFRADRITGTAVVTNPGTVVVPEDVDFDAVIPDSPWDLGAGATFEAVIAFDPPHHLGAIERLGDDATSTPSADGRIIVRFNATSIEAVRSFVLGFLDHAEVLEPPELRADIIAWLAAFAAKQPNGKSRP